MNTSIGDDVDSSSPINSDDFLLAITNLLYNIYMPICCIIGLTGNCMVWILIRSNRILKKLPSNMYLLALSLVSSVFLLSLFIFWIEQITHTKIYSQYTITCKLVFFVAHYCDFCSVWLIVLVSFERLILLIRARRSTTRRHACGHIAALLIIAFILNGWILIIAKSSYTNTIDANSTSSICDIYPQFEYVYTFFNSLDTVVCIGVPSILIIVSNVLVVLKLREHTRRMPSSPTVSFRTADLLDSASQPPTTRIIRSTRFSIGAVTTQPSSSIQLILSKKKKSSKSTHQLRFADLQLTRSLLIVTWVFICLNLPNYLHRMLTSVFAVDEQHRLTQMSSNVVHTLLYTHHAILFYMYIFYSPQMKKRLMPTALKLIECYCFKTVRDYPQHS